MAFGLTCWSKQRLLGCAHSHGRIIRITLVLQSQGEHNIWSLYIRKTIIGDCCEEKARGPSSIPIYRSHANGFLLYILLIAPAQWSHMAKMPLFHQFPVSLDIGPFDPHLHRSHCKSKCSDNQNACSLNLRAYVLISVFIQHLVFTKQISGNH